ncbi:hypothetical protein U0070_022447, partial [Myodes glareolus]
MNQKSKLSTYTNIRNIFFSETSIGISGNSVLLLFHVLTLSSERKPRLTDLPIGFLAVIHLLMLLVASIIATDIFMFHQGWDDITCKSLIFLYRFLRGLSVCATCWLSVLQAITLNPRNSCLAKFKRKLSPGHNLWSLFALCSVYSSISTNFFISMIKTPNVTSDHLLYMTESCSLVHFSFPMKYIMSTLFIFRDVFVMGFMILSSGYMLILLCRHKKQVQHLHSTNSSLKSSPEQRASRTILLLLCFFVLMCILDSFMSFSRHIFKDYPIFYLTQFLVGHSYDTVSPLVFIITEKDIIGLFRLCVRRQIYGASPCVPLACLESSRLSSSVPESPVKQSQAQISLSHLIALLPMSFFYGSIDHHLLVSITTIHILILVLTLREAFLVSLMAFSSGYMLILLCRHKKLSRHLHSTRLSPKSSPGIRDTLTILLFFSIFVLMSFVDSIMNQKRKVYSYTNMRNTFFSEISIGISGNSVLLLFHFLTLSSEHKPRLTDLPIGFLAVIHLLMLLVASIIATDIFMFHQGWDDITCKSLIFLYRFLRGLSVCATCWLSVLQAITLNPRNSCLAKFKRKLSPGHNLWSLFALCSVYSSISTNFFISMIKTPNVTSDHLLYMTESCSLVHFSFPMKYVMSTLFIFRDVLVMGIMILSSWYMLILLCRHKKQVQNLHSISFSPKASPEQRASRTILLLLCLFVLMCILDRFMTFSRHMFKDDPIFYLILILVGHSYASVSPFVFISTEKDIIGLLRPPGYHPQSQKLLFSNVQAQISLPLLIALPPTSFSYRSIGHHPLVSITITHIFTLVMACEVHFQQCWHSEKPFLFSHDPLHRGHANSPGRHKKLSWHLHSTSFSPKAFPEKRDTLTILLLLSVFVLMSILDSIVSWSRTMFLDDPTSYFIQPFVVHSYAAVSP